MTADSTDLAYVGTTLGVWECPAGHRWAMPTDVASEDLARCALCLAQEEVDRLRRQIVERAAIEPLGDLAAELGQMHGEGWYDQRIFAISLDHRMQVFGETPEQAAVALVSMALQREIGARQLQSILLMSTDLDEETKADGR